MRLVATGLLLTALSGAPGAARLLQGQHRTILRVEHVGAWSAACSAGGVRITFTASRLLPTSDVVITRTAGAPLARTVNPGDRVTPEAARAVLAQRWQIAPFSSGPVHVTTASVAGRVVGRQCAASVLATTAKIKVPGTFRWTLPSGWHEAGPRLTSITQPRQRLAAASFPLHQRRPDPGCSPDTARAQLPADGAVVLLLERRGEAGPPRPAHFRLPRPGNLECFGYGSTVSWRERGHEWQAVVLLGRHARRGPAETLLDSLA